MGLRGTRSRLICTLTTLVLLSAASPAGAAVSRPLDLEGRTVMLAGFACLVVLGLALVVLSGIGLSRRRRSE